MDQISDSVVDRSPAALTFLENLYLFNVNMQFRVNEEASGAALNLGKAFFLHLHGRMDVMDVGFFILCFICCYDVHESTRFMGRMN